MLVTLNFFNSFTTLVNWEFTFLSDYERLKNLPTSKISYIPYMISKLFNLSAGW